MKILIKILLTLVVGLVLVLVGSWFYLDRIVHQAIVRVGPQVTGTSVELSHVTLNPMAGELGLRELNIGNPTGFAAPYVFSLDSIDLALDTSTLRDPVLVINSLTIDAPSINYEATAQGDNLRALQANIARNTGADQTAAEAEAEESSRRIIIDHLAIRSGQINVSHYLMPNQLLSVNLPELQMTDLGRRSGGATVAEVAAQILEYLSQQAYQAALNSDQLDVILEDVRGQIEEGLRGIEIDGVPVEEMEDEVRGLLDSLGR